MGFSACTISATASDLVVSGVTVQHLWADVKCSTDVSSQTCCYWCCFVTSNTFTLSIRSIQCQLRQTGLCPIIHSYNHII